MNNEEAQKGKDERADKIDEIIANLKPCPFCGCKKIWYREKGSRHGLIAFIECATCGANTKAASCDMDWDTDACKIVVARWNTRA